MLAPPTFGARKLVATGCLVGTLASLTATVPPVTTRLSAQQFPATRHVLFLNSYQSGYNWGDDIVRGMREELENEPYPIELWVEYMDSRRFGGANYEGLLESFIRAKYRDRHFDAVIAADDAALMFMLKRHDALFPHAPVVFLGINNWELVDQVDRRLYTGLREVLNTEAVVNLATSLRPGTKRIIVVADASPTAAAQLQAYRTIAAQRPELPFVFHDGSTETIETIIQALQRSSPTDAVITTAFTRDVTERYFPQDEAVAIIAQAARAPTFSASVSHLGQGLVAGSENVGLHHAQHAARKVIAVLAGTPPASIPIDTAAGARFIIDYTQLVRWGIDEQLLPPNTLVLNAPSSFYRTHKYVIWAGLSFIVLQSVVIGALVVNIARRKRAEAKLGQAQKMEAIGRLAGGVAHDFNNLLTVIGGATSLLGESLAPSHPGQRYVEEIQHASERAADLTHQLLAFSRKQVLLPTVAMLNRVVQGVEPMLRRVIDEDITLEFALATESTAVRIDIGQIEQVIVNLVLNARDAMPKGGRLSIETYVRDLQAGQEVPDMDAGRYVQLVVSDTGHGMDAETRARIFEPFFTTKGHRGTGLGLATVYGIIKQSGGSIQVTSARGRGTTFNIYLPVTTDPVDPLPAVSKSTVSAPAAQRPCGGTVLLVEDQDEVRKLTALLLRREGYTVLEACSGEQAIERAKSHNGAIDLLLTDVVMPGLSGRELADLMTPGYPGLKVLFMSGYTDAVIAQHGVLESGTELLPKPFTPEALGDKVRSMLEV